MGELLGGVRELHVEAGRREHLFGLQRVVPSNGGTPGRQPEDDGHDHGASQSGTPHPARESDLSDAGSRSHRGSSLSFSRSRPGPPPRMAASSLDLRSRPVGGTNRNSAVTDKRAYGVGGTPALPGRKIGGAPLGVGIVIGGSTTCPSGVRCAK